MKIKITAIVIIVLVLSSSALNTLFLHNEIQRLISLTESLKPDEPPESALADAEELRVEFMKVEKIMSITVNHNDLTDIEEIFSEMIGYLKVEDYDGARVAKSRLEDALKHLRRLTGLNIDAVI